MKRVAFGVSLAFFYYLFARNLTNVINWQGDQVSLHLQDELFSLVRLSRIASVCDDSYSLSVPHESYQVESFAKPPPPQPIPITPTTSTEAKQTIHNQSSSWPQVTPSSGDAVRLSASATPIAIVSVPVSEALHLPTLYPTATATPQRA